ncbi:hypothetical protein GAMM_70016 [Gammaproteobacteria bacterium]
MLSSARYPVAACGTDLAEQAEAPISHNMLYSNDNLRQNGVVICNEVGP